MVRVDFGLGNMSLELRVWAVCGRYRLIDLPEFFMCFENDCAAIGTLLPIRYVQEVGIVLQSVLYRHADPPPAKHQPQGLRHALDQTVRAR